MTSVPADRQIRTQIVCYRNHGEEWKKEKKDKEKQYTEFATHRSSSSPHHRPSIRIHESSVCLELPGLQSYGAAFHCKMPQRNLFSNRYHCISIFQPNSPREMVFDKTIWFHFLLNTAMETVMTTVLSSSDHSGTQTHYFPTLDIRTMCFWVKIQIRCEHFTFSEATQVRFITIVIR